MKSPEAVLRHALLTDPLVAMAVSTRVSSVLAPASAAMPFITYRRAGIQRQQTLGSPSGVPKVTVELDIYAATYESARDVADRVRARLDGYGGSFDNTEVKQASLENEQDDFVSLAGADLPPVYSVKQTYDVLWQEI